MILGNGSKIETKLITVELKMNQKWIKIETKSITVELKMNQKWIKS